MPLSWLARTRAAAARSVARTIMGSPALRGRLARRRATSVEGVAVDPDLAVLLGLDDLAGGKSDLRRCSPAEARARVAEDVFVCDASAPPGVTAQEITLAGPAGPLAARLYAPDDLAAPSPGLMYIHGGGFVTCDLDTHDGLCRRLARGGRLRVVSIAYRLAPEHRFPAAAEDAVAAFRQVAARAAELGLDPTRIAVGGDSAGGNLSAVIARQTKDDAVRPALQVLVYPALDATCAWPSHATYAEGWFLTKGMIEWYYGHYFGADPALRRGPDASPLLAAGFEGLPPALVYTAGFDPLRDEGRAHAERLQAAGVAARHTCFETLLHGFLLMGGVCAEAASASARIEREVGEALREGLA